MFCILREAMKHRDKRLEPAVVDQDGWWKTRSYVPASAATTGANCSKLS